MDHSTPLSPLLLAHRSIRRFKPDPIPPDLIERICIDAVAGSSSSGNLNTFALVLTEEKARRERLYALHMEQEMILQAPLLITFCADMHRTRRWLRLRGARDNFNNLEGFMVAAYDAVIVAQSVALAAEAAGLGICYLGTTLDACPEIADFLKLPETCVPVTTLVIGWPDEAPAKRDRLPPGCYLHRETYQQPADSAFLALHADREVKGWARYRALGPEVIAEMEKLGITSLAQFYTSDMKYSPQRCDESSRKIFQLLIDKGYLDRLVSEYSA